MQSSYGISILVAILLLIASWTISGFNIVPLLSATLAIVPWEAITKREEASYANLVALLPLCFYMGFPPDVVLTNIGIVAVTSLVLMVVKEYINLFDFGTPVKNQMHISYAPAVSSKVTYADGTSKDVLKCANEKQCPSGLKCTTGSLVNLSENECKKSWENVYTPALCNISHTRCASNTDCPQNEVCDKPTCMKRFCGKNKKCWAECRK